MRSEPLHGSLASCIPCLLVLLLCAQLHCKLGCKQRGLLGTTPTPLPFPTTAWLFDVLHSLPACSVALRAASLQAWLEAAWAAGFDPGGAAMFGGSVQCSRKWVGTTEAAALLRYFGCRAQLVEFLGEHVLPFFRWSCFRLVMICQHFVGGLFFGCDCCSWLLCLTMCEFSLDPLVMRVWASRGKLCS
jgi:hypothetical protein